MDTNNNFPNSQTINQAPIPQENPKTKVNSNPQPSPQTIQKKYPLFLIFFLIIFGLSGFGFGIFYYLKFQEVSVEQNVAKKNKVENVVNKESVKEDLIEKNTHDVEVEKPKPSSKPSSSPSSITKGYEVKDTLCYSLTVPLDNNIGEENSCDLSYRASISTPTRKELLVGSSIYSEFDEYTDSKDMAMQWLAENEKWGEDNKIIDQGIILIGDVEAYKIVAKNNISTIESQNTFVYIPNKYKVHSYPVTGFSILNTFSDPDNVNAQKEEVAKLFETWQWK